MSIGPSDTDPRRIPSYAAWGGPNVKRYRDLCSTCNHAEECGDRSTPDRPIFFCEEFEAFAPAAGAPPAPAASSPAAQADPEYSGLCMNCEDRQHCKLPRPPGGVWHCEEYH